MSAETVLATTELVSGIHASMDAGVHASIDAGVHASLDAVELFQGVSYGFGSSQGALEVFLPPHFHLSSYNIIN